MIFNLPFLLKLTATLAVITLFTPFVWMKMGPEEYKYYGPDVPDIYILGATILGKDRDFWGINFAYKFQLIVILWFIGSNFFLARAERKKIRERSIVTLNFIFLLFFPWWLSMYVEGVVDNGCCTDLVIHYSYAMILYALILVFYCFVLSFIFRSTNS